MLILVDGLSLSEICVSVECGCREGNFCSSYVVRSGLWGRLSLSGLGFGHFTAKEGATEN